MTLKISNGDVLVKPEDRNTYQLLDSNLTGSSFQVYIRLEVITTNETSCQTVWSTSDKTTQRSRIITSMQVACYKRARNYTYHAESRVERTWREGFWFRLPSRWRYLCPFSESLSGHFRLNTSCTYLICG